MKAVSCRQAGRFHNVSLRRRVIGAVEVDCRPKPQTIFTVEEGEHLVKYLVTMSDMGFGLSREDVTTLTYTIADKTKNGQTDGRGWFDGFRSQQLKLSLLSPLCLICVSASGDTLPPLIVSPRN